MTKVKVYSKATGETIEVERCIGEIKGELPGPSLIFTAGMHGNEPSGVFALKRVLDFLRNNKIALRGNFYALAGNIKALGRGTRFNQQDLNRLWSADRVNKINENQLEIEDEDAVQQVELYHSIKNILSEDKGPFYFMDLHTTSCETIPFIVLNDSLLNRKFALQYPLPIILGIEEYLEGPLLSYINELGYVSFGFESGQHDEMSSIENHEAFIMVSLIFSACIKKEDLDFSRYYNVLAKNSFDKRRFYEIFFRYKIIEGEQFQMEPGFVNFQRIKKGQKLASSNGKSIYANLNAMLFMPLYQSQGSEGFFVLRKIPEFFLKLSAVFRKLKLDRLLSILPGVYWVNKSREVLMVNRRIARFLAKQIFHLMGYRSRSIDNHYYIIKNREAASRKSEYKDELWY